MYNRLLQCFIIITICFFTSQSIFSQENQIPVRNDYVKTPPGEVNHFIDFGIGLGTDYGGILGIQVGVAPVKHLTLFAAGGYYLYQVGWNVGIKGLIIPKTNKHGIRPFLKVIYGCNSAISAEGIDDYNKIYTGFTAGVGCEFRFGRKKQNGFDFDLNVPFRTPDFWEDYNRMKNDPRLDVLVGPLPIAFSFGYHHEL